MKLRRVAAKDDEGSTAERPDLAVDARVAAGPERVAFLGEDPQELPARGDQPPPRAAIAAEMTASRSAAWSA